MQTDIEYRTVRQMASCGKYPFTVGQLRTLLLDRQNNGLALAVRKIGKRIYLRPDLFDKWIESKAEVSVFDT